MDHRAVAILFVVAASLSLSQATTEYVFPEEETRRAIDNKIIIFNEDSEGMNLKGHVKITYIHFKRSQRQGDSKALQDIQRPAEKLNVELKGVELPSDAAAKLANLYGTQRRDYYNTLKSFAIDYNLIVRKNGNGQPQLFKSLKYTMTLGSRDVLNKIVHAIEKHVQKSFGVLDQNVDPKEPLVAAKKEEVDKAFDLFGGVVAFFTQFWQ